MRTSLARIALLLVVVVSAMAPATSHAARAWLLPSQTILARSGGWVAFDAASADDLFSVNQGTLSIAGLAVTGPDGQPVPPQNAQNSYTRNTFDLELRQPGTYRVALAEDSVTARWEEDGKPKRWRGAVADMATNIPANAAKLEVEQILRRIETFVTVGAPSEVKPIAGAGIELVPAQHPNDLYAGESTKLRFLLDGKPAAGLEVEVIRGGTRYRSSPEAMVRKTDKDGAVNLTWPSAGMYWIDVSLQDEKAAAPNVKTRRVSYNATLEVLPQ